MVSALAAASGAPAELELERRRGDNFARRIALTQNGQALDITGASFLKTVNAERDPADTGNQLYQVVGGIVDAAGGVVEFAPTPLQADQPPGRYHYDIQMTDVAGRKRTILAGAISIKQDITKD